MKTVRLLAGLFLALLYLSLNAQTTTGFNYQAVLRNAAYQPIANQSGTATISILDAGGAELFKELHPNVNTDQLGLFNLVIGTGQALSGNFAAIDWSGGERRLKITVSAGGNTYDFDPSTLQAVPYAKLAERAVQGDADANPTNELQTLSLSGNQLTLSAGGGTVILPQPAASVLRDADNDTRIQVEKNPDEDIIRFDIAGSEKMVLRANRLEFPNNNRNLAFGQGAGASITTGKGNIAIGQGALFNTTTQSTLIAIGDSALFNNGKGVSVASEALNNIAVGNKALLSNTSGALNSAFGDLSLQNNTSGYGNTAMGLFAGNNNTTGSSNTILGALALTNNTTGSYNTALGSTALFLNETATENTAVGYGSMYFNKTGQYNTAVGTRSLFYNTTANYNAAIGWNTLKDNTTGSRNTAVGANALSGNTTGESNVAVGSEALTSATTAAYNTGLGASALRYNTTGEGNTAVGVGALLNNSKGYENVALGFGALNLAQEGNYNIAVGSRAMLSSFGGAYNMALGYSALESNATGEENIAIGKEAMKSATNGSWNIAIGSGCLSNNTSAGFNTAIGYQSLAYNTAGQSNIAIGKESMYFNETGQHNTAIGDGAMYVNAVGNYNTAVGSKALQSIGSHSNTAVGYRAGYDDFGSYFAAAFGSEAANTASDQVMLGDPPIAAIGGYKNWTNFSDGRFKKNVKENVPGLDFVLRLRPVTYTLDIAGIKSYTNGPLPDPNDARAVELYQARVRRAESEITTGFIAQEVEQAAQAAGYDFSGIDKPSGERDPYGLRYGDFTAPLVKAIQEQQALLEQKDDAIETLRRQVEALESRLTRLEATLNSGSNKH